MSLDPERTPVIVAAGQAESRRLLLGPLELAAIASRRALDAAAGLSAAIERVTFVNILSRRAEPAPASELARSCGMRPAVCETTTIGGNTPQSMVGRAAADISAGRLSASLIVGAEAIGTSRSEAAAATSSMRPRGMPEEPASPAPDPVVGVERPGLSEAEQRAGLSAPVHVYPLFESVLAARAGRSPAEQRTFIGRLMAPFTEVAAGEPHAWFRQVRSAGELAEVTPDNRLVAEPYVKRVVAFIGGAQAAALVVTSLATARAFGLDDGALFVWSSADARDVWFPVARPDLGSSPALRAAATGALEAAACGLDEVEALDVYSCFPSAVQMGAAALGIAVDPDRPESTRPLTLTGGLPYFGGPGNNYVTHAIAALFERFRSREAGARRLGLVTGVGWYLTKHSVGLYGTAPAPGGFRTPELATAQADIDASARTCVPPGDVATGPATVDASTVLYERDGTASAAPVIATLADGRRTAAVAAPAEAARVAGRFLVGARIELEQASAGSAPTYRIADLADAAGPVPPAPTAGLAHPA